MIYRRGNFQGHIGREEDLPVIPEPRAARGLP